MGVDRPNMLDLAEKPVSTSGEHEPEGIWRVNMNVSPMGLSN